MYGLRDPPGFDPSLCGGIFLFSSPSTAGRFPREDTSKRNSGIPLRRFCSSRICCQPLCCHRPDSTPQPICAWPERIQDGSRVVAPNISSIAANAVSGVDHIHTYIVVYISSAAPRGWDGMGCIPESSLAAPSLLRDGSIQGSYPGQWRCGEDDRSVMASHRNAI